MRAMKPMVISALIAVLALGSTASATTYAANLLDGVVEVSELVPQPEPSLSDAVTVLDAVKDLPDIAALLEILADNATVATLLSPSNKALADLLDALGMTSANELVAPTLYANRFPGPSNKLLLADCLRLHVIEGVATPENVTAENTFSTLFGVNLTTNDDSLTLTAAASNGFAVSSTSVIAPGGVSVVTKTADGTNETATTGLVHIVDTVMVPTTYKVNLAGFDSDGNFSEVKSFLDNIPNIAAYAQPAIEPLSPQFKGAIFVPNNGAAAALDNLNLTEYEEDGVTKAILRGHSITAYPNATGTSGESKIEYTSYLTIGSTTAKLTVLFNDSVPYRVDAFYDGSLTSANILGSYGPTIVNGAMVYYVDNAFTAFVVANLAAIKEDANRAARRERDRSSKEFQANADALTAVGLTGSTNPFSPEFEGCFFNPNADQLSALADVLNSQTAELADDEERLRILLKCAIGAFIVPSSSLIGTPLGTACDNIHEGVSDLVLATECPDAVLSIGTNKTEAPEPAGLVYVSEVILTDPSDTRRRLLSINGAGPVKGEGPGLVGGPGVDSAPNYKATFFYQDSSDFVASPAMAKRIDDFNGALGLVPSVLVVALSVLCAFSL